MAGLRTIEKGGARARAATLALVCALAVAAIPATAQPAMADDAGAEQGEGSFALNLSMDVIEADDPAHPAHPVTLAVTNDRGQAVVNAQVSFAFHSVADEASAAALSDGEIEPIDQPGSVTQGTSVTGSDGMTELSGIARGCRYTVAVLAEGHRSYERVHLCQGSEAERWEVVLEKVDGSGSGGGDDVEDGAGGDEPGQVRPRPLPSPSGSGLDFGAWFRSGSFAVTGDMLGPAVLAVSGLALCAAGALALARRRSKEGDDGC